MQTLLRKIWEAAQSSTSSSNVLKMMFGTTGSQLLLLLATPLLTRLYDPVSFGILASYSALVGIITVTSSLRYELAITNPKKDQDAVAITKTCLVLVISTTTLLISFLFAINITLGKSITDKFTAYFYLLPVSVLAIGGFQALKYLAIRLGTFSHLAKLEIQKNVTGIVASMAVCSLGTGGLILGSIFNNTYGFVSLFSLLKKELSETKILGSQVKKTLIRYRHFPIYSVPATLINALAVNLPIILLSGTYAPDKIGQLSLATRSLLIPGTVIGTSIGQVFLGKAASAYHDNRLTRLIKSISLKIFFVSILMAFVLSSIVFVFSREIFGTGWADVGYFMFLLIPLICSKITVSSVGTGFFAIGKTKQQLVAQIVYASLTLAPLISGLFYKIDFDKLIIIWSLSTAVGYMCFWLLLLKASNKTTNPILENPDAK